MKWPNKNEFILYNCCSIIICLLFYFCYLGANSYAAAAQKKYLFYLELEKNIPFLPEFILIYFSLNLLMTMPLFYFETRQILSFCFQLILATLIACLCFILFPGELGFVRQLPKGAFQEIYATLFKIDKPHNLAPSLHIVYTYLTIFNLALVSKKRLWHLWGVLMCFSVILTHQHHIFDILTGWTLAFMTFQCFSKAHILKQAP